MKSMPIPKELRQLGVTSAFVCGVKTQKEAKQTCALVAKELRKFDEAIAKMSE